MKAEKTIERACDPMRKAIQGACCLLMILLILPVYGFAEPAEAPAEASFFMQEAINEALEKRLHRG